MKGVILWSMNCAEAADEGQDKSELSCGRPNAGLYMRVV